ncbi:MAG: hypothetical protein K8S23_08070 [Candidatus Cloacimonetes bacterium]|nr:hypothetical protein [Candidatus Cloacimonadota bacterium]
MKRQFVIFTVLIFSICNICAQDMSSSNIKNKLFLKELDENIISTIKILSAFNESANAMGNSVEGSENLKKFLMDMTMECSKIRKKIRNTDDLNNTELEEEIGWIIRNIRSDINYEYNKIDEKTDKNNRIALKNFHNGLERTLKKILKNIVIEEKNILKSQKITQKYLAMQSRHFLYSLMFDYVAIGERLSAENRDLLVYIVSLIHRTLSEAEPQKK